MRRLSFVVAALSGAALAACSVSNDGTSIGRPGAVLQPPTVVATTSRGAVIARDLCAQCHGESLSGALTHDRACPNLKIVQNYTFADFERLLVQGVARSGDEVDTLMRATQGLTGEDRAAVFQYLKERFPDN